MKHDRHVPPARGAVGSVVTLDTADGAYMVEPLTLAPTRGAMPMRWLSVDHSESCQLESTKLQYTNFTHATRITHNEMTARVAPHSPTSADPSKAVPNTTLNTQSTSTAPRAQSKMCWGVFIYNSSDGEHFPKGHLRKGWVLHERGPQGQALLALPS